jgi:hypothetical protein
MRLHREQAVDLLASRGRTAQTRSTRDVIPSFTAITVAASVELTSLTTTASGVAPAGSPMRVITCVRTAEARTDAQVRVGVRDAWSRKPSDITAS